jgi:hypothetical protein
MDRDKLLTGSSFFYQALITIPPVKVLKPIYAFLTNSDFNFIAPKPSILQ